MKGVSSRIVYTLRKREVNNLVTCQETPCYEIFAAPFQAPSEADLITTENTQKHSRVFGTDERPITRGTRVTLAIQNAIQNLDNLKMSAKALADYLSSESVRSAFVEDPDGSVSSDDEESKTSSNPFLRSNQYMPGIDIFPANASTRRNDTAEIEAFLASLSEMYDLTQAPKVYITKAYREKVNKRGYTFSAYKTKSVLVPLICRVHNVVSLEYGEKLTVVEPHKYLYFRDPTPRSPPKHEIFEVQHTGIEILRSESVLESGKFRSHEFGEIRYTVKFTEKGELIVMRSDKNKLGGRQFHWRNGMTFLENFETMLSINSTTGNIVQLARRRADNPSTEHPWVGFLY